MEFKEMIQKRRAIYFCDPIQSVNPELIKDP